VVRDATMNSLFPETMDLNIAKTIPYVRNLYQNNPRLVQQHTGQYETEGPMLIIPNIQNNFIRIQNRLYEKVGEKNNNSLYKQIPTNTSADINYHLIEKATPTNIEQNRVVGGATVKGNTISLNSMYNTEEMERITNEVDRC
jgi:hypothetical protein